MDPIDQAIRRAEANAVEARRWSELDLGSNIITNTSGIIEVDGEPLISLERGGDDQLLLTVDVYDSERQHIAKLRRNAWVFNERDEHAVTTHPATLRLVHQPTGTVLLEARVLGRDRVAVSQGLFWSAKGHRFEITSAGLTIGGITLSDNRIDGMGKAIAIAGDSISIGVAGPRRRS